MPLFKLHPTCYDLLPVEVLPVPFRSFPFRPSFPFLSFPNPYGIFLLIFLVNAPLSYFPVLSMEVELLL